MRLVFPKYAGHVRNAFGSSRLVFYRNQLAEAVDGLDGHYSELKVNARQRLGELYNPSDYPDSLVGLFSVDW